MEKSATGYIYGERGKKMRMKELNNTLSVMDKRYEFAARSEVARLTRKLGGGQNGLAQDEVENSRRKYGANILSEYEKESWGTKVRKAFFTPFTIILMVLAIISFVTDYWLASGAEKDLTAVIIISTMVTISGSLTLFQSVRSSKAAESLLSLVRVTATVTRKGQERIEVPTEEIVVGDRVHLSAGDMIPADIRIIAAKDLFVSQSAMTGESHPVEKTAPVDISARESQTDYQNMVYMGSNVVSGTATGIVVAVGDDTIFGGIARDVAKTDELTSFDVGISEVSWLLIRFMLIMAPTVILINGLTKGDWVEALFFGLSIAVGLTPEMLPMIVTTSLVKGATSMAKEGTVIKDLNAIQNFGAMDVLCTDKTGTLTQDKIVLEYHLDINGQEDARVLRHAYLNSYHQTGLKNLMDIAIIDAAAKELNISSLNHEKVDEIPFDFERRRMSVVVKDNQNKVQMITKGAVEEMLEISSFVEVNGEVKPLSSAIKEEVLRTVDTLNEDGLRVVAVAQKTNPRPIGEFSIADESEMVLIGYLAFLDPPKETTKQALMALKEHQVGVKVLTGDNERVTRAVCQQVGLENETIVSGRDLQEMSADKFLETIENHSVFVKLSPAQKTDIVKGLKENGHTVGFLGDGINDAPAMKASDVGISVDTAVDIAKESADIILLEKDLMILEKGILSGRAVFGNIIKYIKMTVSSNFGNVFSVLVASIFLPFLPMTALQLLVLNLIYDISCISIPWDNMDDEYLKSPRHWDAKSIGSFMKWLGPTSSIFDITTYFLLFYLIGPQVFGGSYHSLSPEKQVLFVAFFHAGWFVESLWSQTLVIHALRTPKIPFLQSRASFIVMTITTLGILIGTVLPFTSIGQSVGLVPLNASYFFWLLLTIVAYIALVTVVKNLYIRRYQELL